MVIAAKICKGFLLCEAVTYICYRVDSPLILDCQSFNNDYYNYFNSFSYLFACRKYLNSVDQYVQGSEKKW